MGPDFLDRQYVVFRNVANVCARQIRGFGMDPLTYLGDLWLDPNPELEKNRIRFSEKSDPGFVRTQVKKMFSIFFIRSFRKKYKSMYIDVLVKEVKIRMHCISSDPNPK